MQFKYMYGSILSQFTTLHIFADLKVLKTKYNHIIEKYKTRDKRNIHTHCVLLCQKQGETLALFPSRQLPQVSLSSITAVCPAFFHTNTLKSPYGAKYTDILQDPHYCINYFPTFTQLNIPLLFSIQFVLRKEHSQQLTCARFKDTLGNTAFHAGTRPPRKPDLITEGNVYNDLTMRRNGQFLNYGDIGTYPRVGGITHCPPQ